MWRYIIRNNHSHVIIYNASIVEHFREFAKFGNWKRVGFVPFGVKEIYIRRGSFWWALENQYCSWAAFNIGCLQKCEGLNQQDCQSFRFSAIKETKKQEIFCKKTFCNTKCQGFFIEIQWRHQGAMLICLAERKERNICRALLLFVKCNWQCVKGKNWTIPITFGYFLDNPHQV